MHFFLSFASISQARLISPHSLLLFAQTISNSIRTVVTLATEFECEYMLITFIS